MVLDYVKYLRGQEWNDLRMYDYNSQGQPTYICGHKTHKASESDAGWVIVKLTFDGNGNPTRLQGPLVGAASGRAGLDW